MLCYLFTYHTYGSWYPDRPKGYVRHGQGILPSDPEMAKVYRDRAAYDTVMLTSEHQQAIIARLVEAVACINCRLHAVATDSTHIHVLVSWRDERTWQQNRASLKKSMTIHLKQKFEAFRLLDEYLLPQKQRLEVARAQRALPIIIIQQPASYASPGSGRNLLNLLNFGMNAEPLLHKIAQILAEHRLEAVMIGNSAAALHGAPVTTLDIDFMFLKNPANLNKLKKVARSLDASILKPYYPVSDLYRVVNDERGLQLDFMAMLHGIRSFEGLKSRSISVDFGDQSLLVACLADIIKVDPTLAIIEATSRTICTQSKLNLSKKTAKKASPRKTEEDALRKESDRALVEQIRRLLALPMNKRTHFLRVRHPSGGSHL